VANWKRAVTLETVELPCFPEKADNVDIASRFMFMERRVFKRCSNADECCFYHT